MPKHDYSNSKNLGNGSGIYIVMLLFGSYYCQGYHKLLRKKPNLGCERRFRAPLGSKKFCAQGFGDFRLSCGDSAIFFAFSTAKLLAVNVMLPQLGYWKWDKHHQIQLKPQQLEFEVPLLVPEFTYEESF